jgi:RND family efflux transporter MFP subunit
VAPALGKEQGYFREAHDLPRVRRISAISDKEMTDSPGRRSTPLARWVPLATGLAVLMGLGLAACSEAPKGAAPPPPTVTVAKPTQRTIVDQDEYVGRFVAVDSVEVRARVSGYLEKVHFQDGQIVKQGDLLFTIDKRPFQNALDQAKANLLLAQSNLKFTEADYARAQQLLKDRTISEQVFDQRAQAYRNAQASVANNEAAVKQAELDLEFTELKAPIAGRIGDRRVTSGNLVTGGTGGTTTLLATIVSLDPIRFEFTFDEAAYLRYERLSSNGQEVTSRSTSVVVALRLIDETGFDHRGYMDFVDNVIDRSTGTIRGRAQFSNPSGLFTPGMFGRVRVPGSPAYQALLVPDAAIGSEQSRKYVLVVDDESIARQKYVTLGQLSDGLRVIKEGLTANDRVVVNGMMSARPGTKVKAQEQTPPQAKAAQPTTE